MKKLVGRILGLIVLAAVIAFGAVNIDTSTDEGTDSASITDYKADFTVAKNGDLTAVETLSTNFPASKHGIFRFFDTRDPNVPKNRLIPTDISVTRDGRDEPFEVLKEGRNRYRNIKIGSADTTIYGPHTYVIRYKIEGALTKGSGDDSTQFYWNLIPSGWKMAIDKYELTVHLPADAGRTTCGVGLGSDLDPCVLTKPDADTIVVTGGSLSTNTPVTLKTGLDIPTPEGDTRPWASGLDPILGQSTGMLFFVLALALLVGAGGFALSISVGEKTPPYPLMYAPPEGIGPAQAAYILTEKVENKAFVATMMYAAEKGAVTLDQKDKSWTLTGTDKTDVWTQVDQVTAQTGSSLGVVNAGGSFHASANSVSSGEDLKSALAAFESNTDGWAKTSGLMVTSGLGGFGGIVLLLAAGLAVYLGAFNPLNMSIIALVPGLFAIGALGVGVSGAGTKRTLAGRDLWSRVGGFQRILSTPSAKDRFDFSGRKELYTSYLPWAVAFDCADEWAKKYRIETGEEPPTPSYFPAYAGVHTGTYVSQMVDSFDSTVSSAISSYEATQSSSSSGGGGGFSGGGGGGGGGGGSW
ncbi:putative membrane protein YgcG [Marmoricola sp. OAE513]|uniref:DUF2207 domain-containing protein n=1 Tax=Marmoricola sp. OAE513 TaxID=2817894 RepID=UPI001AE5922A